MSENVGAIYYTVEADTQKLLDSITPADQSLGRLQKTFDRTDKAANQASFQMTKTAMAVKSIGRESQTAASSLGGLTKLLGGYLTLQGANTLIQMAEGYREMGERIRFATASQEEYELVQQRLLATANGTYRALSEAQEVYILTADSLRSMGYSTEDALDITDSLSYSFVKNAASTQRAQSAINAYAKSIQTGKVQADSWQSILQATPTILKDIADAIGKDIEEVRKLGAEGKLTAQQLNEGLRQSLTGNKAAADGMATTVRDAFNNMRNSLSVYLGESQSATSSTGLLSSAILTLGNNIETVVQVLMVAGAGALAKYIAQTGASVIASGRAMIAARAQATEELRLAQAHAATTAATLAHAQANAGLTGATGAATRAADAHTVALARVAAAKRAASAAGATLAGVLGGPVGIIALLASAGAALLTLGGKAESTKPKIDLLTEALNDLGDAQLRVLRTKLIDKIAEMDSLAGVSAKAGARIEYLNRQLQMHPSSRSAEQWRREIDEQQAAMEGANKELAKHREQMRLVEEEQKKRSGTGGLPALSDKDAEAEKKLQALRDERELVAQVGIARAKLRAIQQLGDKATQPQKDEAARLAAEIYEIEEAQKAAIKSAAEFKKSNEENSKAIAEMAQELGLAAIKGEELAVAKAKLRLNAAATPGEVAQVEALASALYRMAEAEKGRQLLGQIDPLAGEAMRHEKELANLRSLNDAKLLEDQRYIDLKSQAETAHAEKMLVLQEQNFRAQSQWNDLMMSSLDALGSAGTSAISGLVTGMTSGEDAARALANAILSGVVGSFVEMGIAQVKAWAMGETAQMAAASAYVATVSGQVAATTALAAQAAYASTAAIPVFGPELAPAAAMKAASEATAIGTPAVSAASSAFAGGRQYGGPVAPGKMYRINETGAPEVYNAANGQQFMLPNRRGEVVSNKDSVAGMAARGAPKVEVHVHNAPPGTKVESNEVDGVYITNVILADFASAGPISRGGAGHFGWKRQGR